MKQAVCSLAFLFGGFAICAQSAPAQSLSVTALQGQSGAVSAPQSAALRARFSSGCPVAMRLNQSTNSGVRQAGKGQQNLAFAANLRLELSNAAAGQAIAANVKSAEVTVHGYDGTTRFELVSPGQNQLVVRTREIRFVAQDGNGAVADFLVNGIVSASWLEVNSLTYANGTTWKPARGESCTVSPNPIVLVGAGSGAAGQIP